MATLFSKIIAGEIPSYKIAENDRFYAFLDINPLKRGHTLVVPRQEIDYLFDLDDDLLSGMILFARKVATALAHTVPCRRVGMMVIGLEVPHAHIHLIPIEKEGDMRLDNPRVKLSKEEFEKLAETIRSTF